MWRPRDRERFIGAYDPEHEVPDPDRGPGDRWQSDAYRRGARDSRFAYRMNPDRFESRFGNRQDVDREMRMRWNRDARDRGGYGGDYDRDQGRGYDSDYDRMRSFDRGSFDDYGRDYGRDYGPDSYGRDDVRYGGDRAYGGRGGYDRDFDRGSDRSGPHPDRDRFYGSDRGHDYDRDRYRDGGSSYEGDFGVWERDRDWRRR